VQALARALRDVEEAWLILTRQELLRHERILFEETRNEGGWLVEAAIRLQFGGLGPTAIHAGETLFDTAQPVSREVAQRKIEPALFDLRTMLLEPGTTFLARKFEHGIVVLPPKPESTIVDFVDRFP
jgi:hypothetical protein